MSEYHRIRYSKICFFWVDFKKSCFCLFVESKNFYSSILIKYAIYFSTFFGSKTAWMFGKTPPDAIVTPPNNLFNSSSFLTARVM